MKIKLLELFAGSRSIGKEAERLGMEVFSIDYTAYDNINLVTDIYKIKKYDIPFIPDVIWASPDCTTYSIAACGTHRYANKDPKSDYAFICDEGNKRWIKEMLEYLSINKNMIMFIENPRGNFRHMGFMKDLQKDGFKRHTVWYCQYGDKRAKPTDIWTNSKKWIPKSICRNYKYDKEGNIVNRHCHHESARRGSRTGTQGIKNAHERSMIPQELCLEILKSIY